MNSPENEAYDRQRALVVAEMVRSEMRAEEMLAWDRFKTFVGIEVLMIIAAVGFPRSDIVARLVLSIAAIVAVAGIIISLEGADRRLKNQAMFDSLRALHPLTTFMMPSRTWGRDLSHLCAVACACFFVCDIALILCWNFVF